MVFRSTSYFVRKWNARAKQTLFFFNQHPKISRNFMQQIWCRAVKSAAKCQVYAEKSPSEKVCISRMSSALLCHAQKRRGDVIGVLKTWRASRGPHSADGWKQNKNYSRSTFFRLGNYWCRLKNTSCTFKRTEKPHAGTFHEKTPQMTVEFCICQSAFKWLLIGCSAADSMISHYGYPALMLVDQGSYSR